MGVAYLVGGIDTLCCRYRSIAMLLFSVDTIPRGGEERGPNRPYMKFNTYLQYILQYQVRIRVVLVSRLRLSHTGRYRLRVI